MKKIAVVTATRAEFGLLLPLIRALRECEDNTLKIELIVTGTHLAQEYGHTIDEIKDCKLRIDHQIILPVASASVFDISHNQAEALEQFTVLFYQQRYNGCVILGDRYEMLSIAVAAGNTHTPVFHLCGGDTTEGAMDEWIRHAITKISYLHFPTNKQSYERIVRMGENPERVFNFGSTSIDNIISLATMPKIEALDSIGLPDCRYAVCTYHPVTMEKDDVKAKLEGFLEAINETQELEFIITKSNADQGGARINQLLEEAADKIDNIHVYSSLGVVRYLSLMKNAQFVLGNSSSGIIETPVFGIPTINIGDRQKGRLQSESIINCGDSQEEILAAIKKAQSPEFIQLCKGVVSPYGDGHAAESIAKKVIEVVMSGKIDLKKSFYHSN